MDVHSFAFAREPSGHIYQGLLDFALRSCATALLVVRPSLGLAPTGSTVLKRLEAFLESKTESSEWPGTTLFGDIAWVYRYTFSAECADVLKTCTNNLYGWAQPNLPEDLCLLRASDDPWLVSISHEHDGYLCLTESEAAQLVAAMPEYADLLVREETG
jgi:hypothetical protein